MKFEDQELLNKILSDNDLIADATNPLLRDSYKTPMKLNKKEQELLDYIVADRTLKADSIFEAEDIIKHLDVKGKN